MGGATTIRTLQRIEALQLIIHALQQIELPQDGVAIAITYKKQRSYVVGCKPRFLDAKSLLLCCGYPILWYVTLRTVGCVVCISYARLSTDMFTLSLFGYVVPFLRILTTICLPSLPFIPPTTALTISRCLSKNFPCTFYCAVISSAAFSSIVYCLLLPLILRPFPYSLLFYGLFVGTLFRFCTVFH